MKRRTLILGSVVFLCLVIVGVLVAAAAAPREVQLIVHTTLEDFNAGSLYHTGLTRMDDGEVQLLVVGLAGEWITDTNTTGLPARSGHTAIHHNGHLYVLGGMGADLQAKRNVYFTTILADHDLDDWQTTTALPSDTYPNGLYWHASVVVNDWVYVLGGYDGSSNHNTVSFAPIDAGGGLGTWQTTAYLPDSLRILQATVLNGRIYVIGGRDNSGFAKDTVYYATPNANGQISGWTETTAPFVHPTWGHMVATHGPFLYIMGGTHPTEVVSPYTNFATPDPATGDITSWTTTTNMEHNLYGAEGISFNGVLFSTGGAINQLASPSTYVGTTLIDQDDGTVGAWQDTSLIDPARFWHATVRSDYEWIYVINGHNGFGPFSNINRGTTSGVGQQYAPDGTFTSESLNLGGTRELLEMAWNTTIPDPAITTITMEYQTKKEANDPWSSWHGPYPTTPGVGVTTTIPLTGFFQFMKYRFNFSTLITDTTPVLNQVRIKYDLPEYRLEVFKDADPPSGSIVGPGQVISYTLTYSNEMGGITATAAYILDAVPEFTSYLPGSIWGPGANDANPQVLQWDLGTIAPGESGEVGYSVVISDPLPGGILIENTANIYSNDGPNRTSDQVTHTVVIEGPDFVIDEITVSPECPEAGQPLDFQVTVRNQGTHEALEPFWVELYIKAQPSEPPSGPSDHDEGYCLNNCGTLRDNYVELPPGLAPGQTYIVPFSGNDLLFQSEGDYDVYAQVDMAFDAPEYNALWGRHPEEDEPALRGPGICRHRRADQG